MLTIGRQQTWRRQNSGYYGGCTSAHVAVQQVAKESQEYCIKEAGDTCGFLYGGYIVTDIEDQLAPSDNYCYGSRTEGLSNPNEAFSMEWGDCCWVQFTTDDNVLVSGGNFGFQAVVKDPNNNSPQTRLPPIWKIMSGCPAQTIELNPFDLDGDTIKCRWAKSEESFGAWSGNHNFGSITLDEDTCILTYDGTSDVATNGVKPIALQVEDFDANGKVKSSMPIQFLATVWTPTNTNFRTSGRNGPGKPFVYGNLFPEGDDDGDDGRKRRSINDTRSKRSVPDYCSRVPVLDGPTPAAGSQIEVGPSGTTFTLSATSGNGAITRFSYQSPSGMSCTDVDANGDVTCTFTPSPDQYGTNQGFCFIADDAAGMQTERRCISFNVAANDPVPEPVLYDIHDMMDALDPNGPRYNDYGCTGTGNMDHNLSNHGVPVGPSDRQLNDRKRCLRCAESETNEQYEKYSFDKDSHTCLDNKGSAKRAFCECDKYFAVEAAFNSLYDSNLANLDTSINCFNRQNAVTDNQCCLSKNNIYVRYNALKLECCDGRVVSIGDC